MARTQYLSYKLLDTPLLSLQERALLQIIHIRPEYCLENLENLGRSLNRSARTVQRIIDKLVSKGIITKSYTTFKRIILRIVSIEQQDAIASGKGLISQVFKFCKFSKSKKKVHDTTKMSGLHTTSMSEPIKTSNEIKSIPNSVLKKFDFKGKNIENERQRQLEAARKAFGLKI